MRYLIVVMLIILSQTGKGQDTISYKKFAAQGLRRDLDSMYYQLQANHPDIYANWSKAGADKAFWKLRSSVKDSMNRLELTRLVSPFIARFQDAHTFVDVSFENEDIELYASQGGRFFPLGVAIIGDKLYCHNTSFITTDLAKGDEITHINGVRSNEIISELTGLWSADGKENAMATTQRLFSYSLWIRYGWGNHTSITVSREGSTKTLMLEGLDKESFLNLTFNVGGITRDLHIYPDYKLAVFEINSYGNVKATNRFVDSCFRVISKMDIKHIVLDLRKNGGGNSYIGDYFLAHINRKPYSTIRSKRWRLGPILSSLKSGDFLYSIVERDKKTYKSDGEFLQSADFQPSTASALEDSTLCMEGINLYLFTSARTYSSAHMTALAVTCGQLG
ncbi:MAG TPA: hypothetical protein VGD26_05205, partial [Chitinophagaceae bacterium]